MGLTEENKHCIKYESYLLVINQIFSKHTLSIKKINKHYDHIYSEIQYKLIYILRNYCDENFNKT